MNELFEALKTSSVFLARVSFKVPSFFQGRRGPRLAIRMPCPAKFPG